MPVSQVSQVFRSDPYTLPLSQELLGKVLSIKQAKFDQDAQTIQSGINKLGSLDILHPAIKAYANQKVNDLVSNTNDLGGVDLSDANISNQIESMGNDIYGDSNIINGIAATKSIRQLQDFYTKAKTDPKLNKLYAPQNEYHDMSPVSQYLSDPSISAQYTGGSSPTPYVDFKDDLFKNLKNIKASLTQTITPNGDLMYLTEDHKAITPEQVSQAARDMTTPEQQNQMNLDADYQFRGADPRQSVTRAIAVHNDKIKNASSTLDYYNNMLQNSSNDPIAKQRYQALVSSAQNDYNTLASVTPQDFATKYQQDPTSFNRGLYADEFYRGTGNLFAVNETTRKLSPNFATMFNMKYDQAERFHNDEYAFKEQELEQKGLKKDENGNIIKDPSTGFSIFPPNTADANAQPTGEEAFTDQINDFKNRNTIALQNFINLQVKKNPELGDSIQSDQTGTGLAYSLKGQQTLEGNNNQPGLQLEDFNIPQGSATYNNLVKQGVTPKQIAYYQSLYDAYDQLSTGKDNGINKFPDGFRSLVEQLQINTSGINANQQKIQNVNTQVAKQYGLTDADQKLWETYNRVIKSNKEYRDNFYKMWSQETGTPGFVVDLLHSFQDFLGDGPPAQASAADKQLMSDPKNFQRFLDLNTQMATNGYQKAKSDLFNQAVNRPVYSQPIVDKGFLGNKSLESLQTMAAYLLHTKGTETGTHDVDPKDIKIISGGKGYGVTPDVLNIAVTNPKTQVTEYGTLPLDPIQSKEIGFQEGPYDALNEATILNGTSDPLLITANINPNIPGRKNPLSAKVVILHISNDRNDGTSNAMIVDKHGNRTDIPNTTKETPGQAYAAAKAYLQTSENYGLNYEGMLKKIKEDSYKQQN